MAYEAARVRRGERGAELVDAPKSFDNINDALAYVAGTPVSKDGNRPWIRDTLNQNFRTTFLMVGGKSKTLLIGTTVADLHLR